MIFIDKLKNMKIYKTPTFLPTIDGDKKKKSSVILLTPNYASSKKLLDNPLFVNKLRFASYYLERDISYYINDKVIEEAGFNEAYSVYQLLTEMKAADKAKLKDSDFGLPKKRKYPLDTASRVRSAVKFFNYVSKEDEKELAENIIKAINKFNVKISVGKDNRLSKYYQGTNESSVMIEELIDKINDKHNLGVPVYFIKDVTPENVLKAYQILEASGNKLDGKVACKVHSGEAGNQNFLKPEMFAPLIEYLKGTVVECNTAYKGKRYNTEDYEQVIKDHGWDRFPIDIMDRDGEIQFDIPTHNRMGKNYVGSHIEDYDSMIVLSHFKGHGMGGYGGALKQLSIGCASKYGKKVIHGWGSEETGIDNLAKFTGKDEDVVQDEQIKFTEAMADAASSVHKYFSEKGGIVYINIMANMSKDCDCDAYAGKPVMQDIGILISTDPVAIDKACLDLIYNSSDPGKEELIQRIDSRNGRHIIDACQNIMFGTTNYNLIEIGNSINESYIIESEDNTMSITSNISKVTESKADTLVFDLGGVLLEGKDWKSLIRKEYPEIDEEFIDKVIETYSMFLDKSDTASYQDALAAFSCKFNEGKERGDAVKIFDLLLDTVEPYDYTYELLDTLKENGFKLYYLSNWSKYGFEKMQENGKLDFLDKFDGGLVSYQCGFMKPEREIYDVFLDKFNLKPEKCCFFDDKDENVIGAKSTGMDAYVWGKDVWTDNSIQESIDFRNFPLKSQYFDKKDNAYNIDKFISGERNILYVTGLSGSGKSTLSIDLANKYKAEYIELDFVMLYFMKKYKDKGKQMTVYDKMKLNCPDASKFLNKTNEMKYSGFIDWKSRQTMAQVTRDFISWFEANYSGNGKKYIICGSFIFEFVPYDFFIDRSIIIKQNNIYKTLYRRTIREVNMKDYTSFKDWVEGIKKHIKMSQNLGYKLSSKSVGIFSDRISNSIGESKESLLEFEEFSTKLSRKDIENTLKEFAKRYDPSEWCLTTKVALIYHGLYDEANDIDMKLTTKVFNKMVKDGYEYTISESSGDRRIEYNDRTECFDCIDKNYIKNHCVKVNGYYIEDFETLLKFYKSMNRPKDQEPIRRIEKALKNKR